MASPDINQQLQQPSWPAYEPTKDCSQGFCSIYCPQWCYIVFPPPPPFSSFDEPDDSSSSPSSVGPTFSPLLIAIIGILATAFLLVTYYTVVSKYCNGSFFRPRRRRRPHPNPQSVSPDDVEADSDDNGTGNHRHEEWVPPTVGLDEALISKITVCKYRRGDGLVGCTDCSVCLGEFRDEESLRLLPKCSHAFHVHCIDTWLRSHSNCPLCRANIVPVPPLPPETNHRSEGVLQNDETIHVAVGEQLDEGTSLGNDSNTSSKEILDVNIEIRDDDDEDQRMRRSFSMGSLDRSRVSVADILQVDLEEEEEGPEILVGSESSSERGGEEHGKGKSGSRSLHYVTGSVPMKRSMSSGRFSLTRQGRGRNSVLPI